MIIISADESSSLNVLAVMVPATPLPRMIAFMIYTPFCRQYPAAGLAAQSIF